MSHLVLIADRTPHLQAIFDATCKSLEQFIKSGFIYSSLHFRSELPPSILTMILKGNTEKESS